MTDSSPNYCYRHPNRETTLRCNSCDRYICASCAIHTPTGYKCPECIRERNNNFLKAYTNTRWYDYLVAPVVGGVLGLIGTLLISLVSFFGIFAFIVVAVVGPMAGVYVARVVQWSVKRRRSKYLPAVATAGVAAGGLLTKLPTIISMFLAQNFSGVVGLLIPLVFIFLVASTTYVRMAGIQLRR